MKLLAAICLLACACSADKLDNTYLPPDSAHTAGGDGSFLVGPSHHQHHDQAPATDYNVGRFNAPQQHHEQQSDVLSYNNDNSGDGTYNFAFQTANGISQQEQGHKKDDDKEVVRGSYSFTAPDGQTFTVMYEADENGFRPVGNHIQTPVVPTQPEQHSYGTQVSGGQLSAGHHQQHHQTAAAAPSHGVTSFDDAANAGLLQQHVGEFGQGTPGDLLGNYQQPTSGHYQHDASTAVQSSSGHQQQQPAYQQQVTGHYQQQQAGAGHYQQQGQQGAGHYQQGGSSGHYQQQADVADRFGGASAGQYQQQGVQQQGGHYQQQTHHQQGQYQQGHQQVQQSNDYQQQGHHQQGGAGGHYQQQAGAGHYQQGGSSGQYQQQGGAGHHQQGGAGHHQQGGAGHHQQQHYQQQGGAGGHHQQQGHHQQGHQQQGHHQQDAGHYQQQGATGQYQQGAGHHQQGTGHHQQGTGHHQQGTGHHQQGTGHYQQGGATQAFQGVADRFGAQSSGAVNQGPQQVPYDYSHETTALQVGSQSAGYPKPTTSNKYLPPSF